MKSCLDVLAACDAPQRKAITNSVDNSDFRQLPTSNFDPFRDEMGIWETYIFDIEHRMIDSELRVLTGSWDVPERSGRYGVGMLVFRGISEYAWMTRDWDVNDHPHWWTVLESGFVSLPEGPYVTLPPIPGWPTSDPSEVDPPQRPTYRYRFYLNPNAQFVVQFELASFVIGAQPMRNESRTCDRHLRIRPSGFQHVTGPIS